MEEKKLRFRKKTKSIRRKLDCNKAEDEYNVCKENINVIHDEIANRNKIRSRCNWYELDEKSNKFFVNSLKTSS